MTRFFYCNVALPTKTGVAWVSVSAYDDRWPSAEFRISLDNDTTVSSAVTGPEINQVLLSSMRILGLAGVNADILERDFLGEVMRKHDAWLEAYENDND